MNFMNTAHTKGEISSNSYPKVSIIVATYRRKETLKRALHSIMAQTYNNIEIIVVDDNAETKWNSEVEKIIQSIKAYNEHEIIYLKNKVNKGSAETRNIGIIQATGEYITFLDDDDIYLPNKIKNQVEHMAIEASDFSLTDLWLYNEQGRLIEKRTRDYIKDFSSNSLLRYHLMYHLTGTDVMMFKKKYLLEIEMFSPINVGDEFYLMQKAILGRGTFSYLPGCDVKAYIHSETEGLSSGDGKIEGEHTLYEHKKNYFNILTTEEKKYIKMRHYAVLAFAEYRRKKYYFMVKNLCISLISSPIKLIYLVINRK